MPVKMDKGKSLGSNECVFVVGGGVLARVEGAARIPGKEKGRPPHLKSQSLNPVFELMGSAVRPPVFKFIDLGHVA